MRLSALFSSSVLFAAAFAPLACTESPEPSGLVGAEELTSTPGNAKPTVCVANPISAKTCEILGSNFGLDAENVCEWWRAALLPWFGPVVERCMTALNVDEGGHAIAQAVGDCHLKAIEQLPACFGLDPDAEDACGAMLPFGTNGPHNPQFIGECSKIVSILNFATKVSVSACVRQRLEPNPAQDELAIMTSCLGPAGAHNKPVTCPPFVPTCPAGKRPADTNGDGCVDGCR